MLVVGGENDYTRKHATTGFLFDGAAWQSLPDKGLPVITRAHVIADERSETWLLVGARDRKGNDDHKVHELTAGKWRSYASSIRAHVVSMGLLGWDAASGQVFVLATLFTVEYVASTHVFVYRGAGQWHDCGTVETRGGTAAFDAARRVLVFVVSDPWSVSELDIAPLLDAAGKPEVGKPAAKKTAVKKAAVKKPPEQATAHLIRFVKKGADHYGGLPRGVDEEHWPMCKSCGVAMQHVLAVGAHASRLPLKAHKGLAVFVCNSGKNCATWDPDAGCNAVLLLTRKQLAQEALAEPPRGRRRQKPSPVIERLAIGYETRLEDAPDAEDVEPTEAASKLGGYPVWVQSPQVPSCGQCDKPMRFVAQLMEETGEVNFGGGDGYVFCCDEEHEAKFLWQQ